MIPRRQFVMTAFALLAFPGTAIAQQKPEITVYLNPG
jgi:hypothetical protein